MPVVHANWIKGGAAFRMCSNDGDYWVECMQYSGWDHYKDLTEEEADDLIEAVSEKEL